jgi:hypothetical protein
MAVTINGTTGIGLPNTAAPVMVAYLNNNQTGVANSTFTKVTLANTEIDTNSNFNTTTYRWTPTIAGYYQISAVVQTDYTGSAGSSYKTAIYKNGTLFRQANPNGSYGAASINCAVYMNGSSDYLELYGMQSGGSGQQFDGYANASVYCTWLSAIYIRN